MFKNLFNRDKAPKQPPQKVVVAQNEETAGAVTPAGNKAGKGSTVLRSTEPMETLENNQSLLQLAEEGGWEVKNVPEYNIGDIIDDLYKIAKKFSGGMGFVYITEPTGQGIRFAIKQPKQDMVKNKNFFGRVIREAETWNGLGMHPNIAYCYFVKPVDNVPCIFIEYVDGGNLREWIAEGECLDIRASLDMAIQFCRGMEHAHKKGAIHRDIKPENVLMTKEGSVKVTDFGLAGALEKAADKGAAAKGSPLTQFGDVMGTEAYMAPEQWEDPHNVDARADIFSFGVCLWEMFCGKRPYKIAYGDSIETPTPAQTLRPELTASHIKLLYKCIELDKEKRYKDFTELREALNSIYHELYHEDAPDYTIELPDSLADELNNRGYSYYQLGDKQKARKYWELALQATPKHLIATYNLNYLRWDYGEITGDELLRQLELTENRSPQYWLSVGWIYYMQGNHEAVQKIQDSENKITDPQFLKALERPNRPLGRFVKEFGGHASDVYSVCFSPDGRYVLSGSSNIHLREASTGKEIRKFEGHADYVNSVCFSRDGKYVLSGSSDKTIRLWEAATGKEIRKFEGHTERISSVCFSPDEKEILSGSWDNTLRLWEASTRKEIRKFEGHTKSVTSVCFSPDGRFILSGSWETINFWDAAMEKEIQKFEGNTFSSPSVCFSTDGKFVLSGGGDKIIRLLKTESGKEIRKFEGHAGYVNSVCFSRDGKYVLSGSSDKTIRLWEAATGKEIRKFEGHMGEVKSVCFSPDGRYVLSGSNTIRKQISSFTPDGRFTGIANRFVTIGHTIHLWEISSLLNNNISKLFFPTFSVLHTSEQIIRLQKEANLLFNDAKLVKESGNFSKAITILRQIQRLRGYGQKLEILDLVTICRQEGKGFPIRLRNYWIKIKMIRHTESIKSVCFSPDGRYVLSGSYDDTIRLWDASMGKEIRKLEGHSHPRPVNSVCFSPDGRFFLSGSLEIVQLWEAATGKEIRKFEGHMDVVTSVCFSPDGRYVLSGSWDNTLRLWEVATGKEIRQFEEYTVPVSFVCFSPNGRYVLSGSDNSNALRLWEVATGKEIRQFERYLTSGGSVCFSPDGRYVLSGSLNATISLWNAFTGKEIQKLAGHTNSVRSVCFSPDGRFVLSGSSDNTIRLWDTATGKEIRSFEGHTDSVESVCFSPDGRYVLSGSSDKTVLLWELDWEWEFPEEKA